MEAYLLWELKAGLVTKGGTPLSQEEMDEGASQEGLRPLVPYVEFTGGNILM